MQPSQERDDEIEKHFPNTARLLHEREARNSESPARNRDEPDLHEVDHGLEDDAEAAQRLEARLLQARNRRERLLEARRLSQAEASAVRKRKKDQVTQLRQEAVQVFIQTAPAIFRKLSAGGLTSAPDANPDVLEHVMISDPRVCKDCPANGEPLPPVCPFTHKPHRRSLVVSSEALLKLIGNAKVNLTRQEESATPAARRGIRVHPHLFVLAYYYATLSPTDLEADSPMLITASKHLVSLVSQLDLHCSAATGNATQLVTELLTGFAKTWRQYVKLATAHAQNAGISDPAERDRIQQDLIQSTTEALIATHIALTSKSLDPAQGAALQTFIETLNFRLREFGGATAQEAAHAAAVAAVVKLTTPEQEKPTQATDRDYLSTPPLTPERAPRTPAVVAPPLQLPSTSHYGTSSDTDRERSVDRPQYGPSLPPNWFVDASGISRPPPPETANAILGSKRQQLEMRARTAFQTKLKIVDRPTDQETAVEKMTNEMREAAFLKLKNDLNSNPPVLNSLPMALSSIADAVVEALPQRLRSKIGKEIKDVLDWGAVRKNVRHDEKNIAELMKYVVSRVIELGAPARDEALRTECSQLELRLQMREDPLGDIVADILRFMLSAIRQLRLDISAFTLNMISDELAQKAEVYHAEYLKECFTVPVRWTNTIAFFQQALPDAQRLGDLLKSCPAGAVATTPVERILRVTLFHGVLDLLRSAGHQGDDRWTYFPTEALSIERQQIFEAANAIQQDTLSLMLSGVVGMILHTKKFSDRNATATILTSLDAQLRHEFLASATSITELQTAIIAALEEGIQGCNAAGESIGLSDSERNVLGGMIAKMVDTSSTQYTTFEGRVVAAVCQAFYLDTRAAQSVPVSQRPKTIGLASESAFITGSRLRCVLDYNWSALRPFYMELSRTLTIPETLLAVATQDAS